MDTNNSILVDNSTDESSNVDRVDIAQSADTAEGGDMPETLGGAGVNLPTESEKIPLPFEEQIEQKAKIEKMKILEEKVDKGMDYIIQEYGEALRMLGDYDKQ